MHQGWDEHQALASRSRAALLEVLRADGGALGVEELADAVGLHVNTTREHLDRLVGAGLVARAPEHRTTRGRPRILYRRREPVGARVRAVMDEVLLAGYGEAMDSPAEAADRAGREAADRLAREQPLERAQSPAEARRHLQGRAGPARLRAQGRGRRRCGCATARSSRWPGRARRSCARRTAA